MENRLQNNRNCLNSSFFRLIIVVLVVSSLLLGFLFLFRSCLGMSSVDRLRIVENKVKRLEKENKDCKCSKKPLPSEIERVK